MNDVSCVLQERKRRIEIERRLMAEHAEGHEHGEALSPTSEALQLFSDTIAKAEQMHAPIPRPPEKPPEGFVSPREMSPVMSAH